MYSRKQAGIIYRAFKEGLVVMSQAQVSKLYNWCDSNYGLVDAHTVQCAVNAIFLGNYELAQTALNGIEA